MTQPLHARPEMRIWALSCGFAVLAVVGLGLVGSGPLDPAHTIPWWALAMAFYAAELLVVHLSFGRDAHTFSMSEVPLVVGLATLGPVALVGAQLIGTLAVLAGHRRQAPYKLVFNLSEFALQTTVAVVVYRSIVDAGSIMTPVGWFGAIAATMAALASAHLMVYAAIRVTGGSLQARQLVEAVAFSAGATLMNTVLGLVMLAAVIWSPPVVALALAPALVIFAAYRWFAVSRQERQRLKALYEATRDLHQSPQLETALAAAARHARAIFDAELCEIRLRPIGPGDVYRTIVGPGDRSVTMQPVETEPGRSAWDVAVEDPTPTIVGAEAGLTVWVDDRPRDVAAAMVVPVMIDEAMVGSVMVANHIGDIGVFESSDLKLLETLASHVAVSVENGRLEDSLEALTELKERLRHQALHDALTGLANRTLFAERVEHALERAIRTRARLAVLFLDLDDFKTVNDSLGHGAGDELLVAVANRLRSHCRPGDTIARLGGDEFAVLLEEIDAVREATGVAERILSGLNAPSWIEGRDVTISASIGIAFGTPDEPVDRVLRDADAAMYVAKRSGKGTFRLFESEMHAEVVGQLQMRSDLDAAVGRGDLRLRYQPIVDLRTGRILGFEALVRWQHADRGLIMPADFVPFAEETGLIHKVGRWVLTEALAYRQEIGRRFGASAEALEISVNVSAKQLDNISIVDEVAKALGESAIPPSDLVIEITETAVMNAPTQVISRLRDLGVRIAVDDFGTGYSSLASLDRLPVDILKVDQSFVRGMSQDHDTSPLISTIVGLSQWLGLYTVVEGVETRWQIDRLRTLGCNIGQGFFFSEPLDAEAAMALVERQVGGEVVYPVVEGLRSLRSIPLDGESAGSA